MPRKKLQIEPLGVDITLFQPTSPNNHASRAELRRSFGVQPEEVLCIYTGRLATDKAPHILAQAVASMRATGAPIRSLFVGAGPEEYVAALGNVDGCSVVSFRQARELADLYRASDIGVWPREESTSQLDAMASGLPIVISDRVETRERIGVGAVYAEGSPASMAAALATLLEPARRAKLGDLARSRVEAGLSWDSLAERRLAIYETVLSRDPRHPRV